MPVNLHESLAWKQADADQTRLLQDLQANILKGHGRSHTAHLFLHFADAAAARSVVQLLAPQVTDARQQLVDAENFKLNQVPGGLVTLLFLTHGGYSVLGLSGNVVPDDPAFVDGMAARHGLLADPAPSAWDKHLRGSIHAMVLLADDTAAQVRRARNTIVGSLPSAATLLGEETGLGMASRLSPGEGIEHFGYVDGRSQPLLLKEQVARERDERDGISVWNPEFPLSTALVRDPGGKTPQSFGSYFVFRKLEQNVRGFKRAEENLAKALGLTGEDEERAGAMMVGRFEDGTPVVLQRGDGMNDPVPNNFDFRDDASGAKCPLHSHIRKSNPRGESASTPAGLAAERSHIMVRRGITYGKRAKHPNSRRLTLAEMPTKDVGLLFMAYQNDIANQFEFTQASWVNNPDFVRNGTGIDPVIGQGPAGGQACPVGWGGDASSPRKSFDFRGFVKMKGGAYFFAPSISFLKSL